jgi:hypothetical protein
LGFDSCTTPIQQLHNNPSHEGGPQYVGPTLMWGIVVQLLYWCCKSNIFHIFLRGFDCCTTPAQYGHNTPSHEGGAHTLGPTLMWEGVVPMLCGCSKTSFFFMCIKDTRKTNLLSSLSLPLFFFFKKKKLILSRKRGTCFLLFAWK